MRPNVVWNIRCYDIIVGGGGGDGGYVERRCDANKMNAQTCAIHNGIAHKKRAKHTKRIEFLPFIYLCKVVYMRELRAVY